MRFRKLSVVWLFFLALSFFSGGARAIDIVTLRLLGEEVLVSGSELEVWFQGQMSADIALNGGVAVKSSDYDELVQSVQSQAPGCTTMLGFGGSTGCSPGSPGTYPTSWFDSGVNDLVQN